jgi:hypothetical protein
MGRIGILQQIPSCLLFLSKGNYLYVGPGLREARDTAQGVEQFRFSRLKNPSQAALSGESPFRDIDRISLAKYAHPHEKVNRATSSPKGALSDSGVCRVSSRLMVVTCAAELSDE